MIGLLFFDRCPSAEAEALVRRILVEEGRTAPLLKIAVETPEQAVATRCSGFSPGTAPFQPRSQAETALGRAPCRTSQSATTGCCRLTASGNGVGAQNRSVATCAGSTRAPVRQAHG
jgi:hypothetical protein